MSHNTQELKKQIIVGLCDDGQCGIHIDPDITAAEAMQLVGTLALHILNAYYAIASKTIASGSEAPSLESDINAARLGIKQSMYDAADSVFSNVLATFYPDAPNLEIEDEAILELTNQKIEERYNAMSEEDKAKYSEAYHKMLDQIAESHE